MTEPMIVEAIRSIQLNQTSFMPTEKSPSVAQVADPAAVARFQEVMEPKKVEDIPFADKLSATWRSAQDNHQGMLHRIHALTELRGERSLTSVELSQLQYEVANMSFQQEVVAKVADKASNAVQTLIKNQ